MTEPKKSPSWNVVIHDRTESGALIFIAVSPNGTEWVITCSPDGSWTYHSRSGHSALSVVEVALQAAVGRYLVACYHAGQAVMKREMP